MERRKSEETENLANGNRKGKHSGALHLHRGHRKVRPAIRTETAWAVHGLQQLFKPLLFRSVFDIDGCHSGYPKRQAPGLCYMGPKGALLPRPMTSRAPPTKARSSPGNRRGKNEPVTS